MCSKLEIKDKCLFSSSPKLSLDDQRDDGLTLTRFAQKKQKKKLKTRKFRNQEMPPTQTA